MAKTNEYLERRCAINEAVLHDLGQLLVLHFPALHPQLSQIGRAWSEALDKLDAEIPDAASEVPDVKEQ